MADFKPLLAKIATGQSLTRAESETAFNIMMSGEATPSQIGAFLMGLRVRGETVDEIAGAVATMRAKVTPVEAPSDAMDIVGTGGDAAGTYNISTTSALVVAGAGVPVAKHGNRALSSKSGAADVLAALGVKIDLSPDMVSRCIREAGIGFMFAPAHHSAMKHVGPSRVELGTRTVFNLLGPLSNPAGVKRLLVGMFSPQWLEPTANVLKDLGTEAAWVVHGAGGVDEISVAGKSTVVELKDGKITTFEVSPADVGLAEAPLDAVRGGDADENARALREVLGGAAGAYRDTVLMNAGAALVVAGKAKNLAEGVERAAAAIDEGKAKATLDKLIAVSNS